MRSTPRGRNSTNPGVLCFAVTEHQEPRKKEQPDTGTRRAAIGGTAAGGQLAGGGFLSRRDLLREVASA
jgi:hypothetical protein